MAKGTAERILDGALHLFATQGVQGTQITDIERSAGLKPGSGSFYRHFASKDAVFEAVIEREIERIEAATHPPRKDTPVESEPDVRMALAMEFQQTLADFERMRYLFAILARERQLMPRLTEAISEALLMQGNRLTSARYEARMKAGQIPERDALALADVLLKALIGHHLARDFFGDLPSGVDQTRFISCLVDLVAPLPT